MKLSCDYPWLPFEQGGMVIEDACAQIEDGQLVHTLYTTSIVIKTIIGKDFTISTQLFD